MFGERYTGKTGTSEIPTDDGNRLPYTVRTGDFSHEILVTFDISSVEKLEIRGFWFGDGGGEGKLSAEDESK